MLKEFIVIFNNIANFNQRQYLMLALSMLIAYLIGCLSPATIISKLNGVDIKNEGSGNAGTTNVLRVIGPKAAAITLIIDIFKGIIAVKIGMDLTNINGAAICAVMVVIGHIFPVFYKFKGGKGVATAFGAVLVINWPSAFAALILVLLTVAISKKMSMGSIIGAVSYPLLILYYFPRFLIFAICLALILLLTHIPNIKRLIDKEESSLDILNREPKASPKEEVEKFQKVEVPEIIEKPEEVETSKNYFSDVSIPNLKPRDKRKLAFIGMNPIMTAVANIAAYNGHSVMMWSDDQVLVNKTREDRINEAAFEGVTLAEKIQYTYHIMTAANKRHVIFINGDYETVKVQLQRIAKKANINTLIVNLIESNNSANSYINRGEVKSIMQGNPYAELHISSSPEELIENKDAIFNIKANHTDEIEELKRIFTSGKIDVVGKPDEAKNEEI